MIARTCRSDDEAVRRICRNCNSDSVKKAYAYMRVPEHRNGRNCMLEVLDDVAFYFGYFGKRHFRLIELAVEADSQGSGYGSAALRRLVDVCGSKDVDRITFRCSAQEGFAGFYIRHGARIIGKKADDYEMVLRLEEYID